MMEWTIVVALSTLVGLFVAICTPIIKLNGTIQKLNVLIQTLSEKAKESKLEQDKIADKVNDHEKRITILETKGEK